MGLGAFFPELQMFSQSGGGAAAALSSLDPGWRPLSPQVRESLWSQIQSGITANLTPGESQVSLNLNPPELGHIQLNLRLVGQVHEITVPLPDGTIDETRLDEIAAAAHALITNGLAPRA